MPKRATGAHKKKKLMTLRQKDIRTRQLELNLAAEACNIEMVCDSCHEKQKNRAFCYFCSALQRLPQCVECGKTKCQGGDCLISHAGKNVTGMLLVGAICDFCEGWVCHSRKCISTHACRCPIAGAVCIECERSVPEQGGRFFKCATCDNFICEDDQLEHQASCQTMVSETGHCISCNRLGVWSCLRCKIAFCDTHVKSKLNPALSRKELYKCKKCGYELQETKMLSISTKQHTFGRQTRDEAAEGGWFSGRTQDAGLDMGALSIGSNESSEEYTDSEEENDDDTQARH